MAVASAPPKIDQKMVSSYMGEIERLLGHATLQEKKKWIRTMVREIKLAPEEQEITITYSPPGLFMVNELAGTYDDVIHEVFIDRLVRMISLPRRGRRKRSSNSSPTVATA